MFGRRGAAAVGHRIGASRKHVREELHITAVATELRTISADDVEQVDRDDEPGFWEGYGYHNYGDPWKEQRYAGD